MSGALHGNLIATSSNRDWRVKSLLHFNGANGATDISDDTGRTWSNFGKALSTAQKRFGTASLLGNAYISTQTSSDFIITGAFTIECWINPNRISGGTNYEVIWEMRNTNSNYGPVHLFQNNAQLSILVGNSSHNGWQRIVSVGTLTASTWHHVAACGNGTTLNIYLNGTSVDSVSQPAWTSSYTPPIVIGGAPAALGDPSFQGYIDEFRFTNGLARYTSNFTPPTAEFSF